MFFSSFLFPALLARRTEGEPPVGVVSGILARIFWKHPLDKKETTDGIPRNSKGFPPPKMTLLWRCLPKRREPLSTTDLTTKLLHTSTNWAHGKDTPNVGHQRPSCTPDLWVTPGSPWSPLGNLGHPWATSYNWTNCEQQCWKHPQVDENALQTRTTLQFPNRQFCPNFSLKDVWQINKLHFWPSNDFSKRWFPPKQGFPTASCDWGLPGVFPFYLSSCLGNPPWESLGTPPVHQAGTQRTIGVNIICLADDQRCLKNCTLNTKKMRGNLVECFLKLEL